MTEESTSPIDQAIAYMHAKLILAFTELWEDRSEHRRVLAEFVSTSPKCTTGGCSAPATRADGRGGARYCDLHGVGVPTDGPRLYEAGVAVEYTRDVPEYPRAKPLREAQALLARGRP